MWDLLTEAAPVILQLIALLMNYVGAKEATLADFQALVEASKDEGLISEDTKNVFLSQIAALQNAVVDPTHVKAWRDFMAPHLAALRPKPAVLPVTLPQPIGVALSPANPQTGPVVEKVAIHLTVSDQPFPPPVVSTQKF